MGTGRDYAVVGGPDGQIAAVRNAIGSVRGMAVEVECDVPLSQSASWPADVRAAAEVLCERSVSTRGRSSQYRQTGMLSAASEETWRAFVTFAPYAFDASVFGSSGRPVIHLADEGQSCVVAGDSGTIDQLLSLGIEIELLD